MAVRLPSDDEILRRSLAIRAMSDEWVAQQLAAGVDGPTPDDRPRVSDYNQHVPILEADGAAQDDYFARLDAILAGGS